MDALFNRETGAVYGVPEEVAPGVSRITCQNPSPMTFLGTRSYVVGNGRRAVIDPGPLDEAHLACLAAQGPVSHILVTHAHRDHSAGAARLAEMTGAPVYGFRPPQDAMSPAMRALSDAGGLGGGEGIDRSFRPDHVLGDGDVVEGDGWRITAVHTPGHLSDHLSFALSGTGILFTGDTVMGWATTLVSPPEGDMAAFMGSLRRLQARDDSLYLPGHGHPIPDPQGMLAHQIAHREARFDQILGALADGPATPRDLTVRIYTDVDSALLGAAERNVLASLIGLADLGQVAVEGPLSATARFRLAG